MFRCFFHCDLDHDQMVSMLKFGQDIQDLLQYQNEVSMFRHSESRFEDLILDTRIYKKIMSKFIKKKT